MKFSLFFSLNTFQTISTLTAVIFLSFSTIRSQISSLKLYAILVSLFFSKLAANDRGYGLGRAAGEFPVVKRQGKCGRKDCQKHISRPKRIGVC